MKKNSLILFIAILIANASYSQDSVFLQKKLQSLQYKLQREIEKNIDVLYPSKGYLEKFLFFKVDSTKSHIVSLVLIDEFGVIDSITSQIKSEKIVMYWKDFLPENIDITQFTFIQPVLLKKRSKESYKINVIPNFYWHTTKNFTYIIRLPQIDISVGEQSH